MISAIELTKKYEDGVTALDALDLQVGKGEVYCLLGGNGAGKTTTINIFLNFIEPTSGRALVNGVDVAKSPLEAKRHIGYVSENVMLYGNFTARQNVDFFARLGGKNGLKKGDYDDVLKLCGLPLTAFDRRVKEFSKGMRQKVGLAICMVKDAPALLLDEPTSGLDPKAGAEFNQIMLTLKERGKAILMSTHDIFRAKEIADRVAIMREGRKVLERTAAELRHEDLQALYLEYMR